MFLTVHRNMERALLTEKELGLEISRYLTRTRQEPTKETCTREDLPTFKETYHSHTKHITDQCGCSLKRRRLRPNRPRVPASTSRISPTCRGRRPDSTALSGVAWQAHVRYLDGAHFHKAMSCCPAVEWLPVLVKATNVVVCA